jgi:integrase
VKARIGEADDVRDADGTTVLDWKQAQDKAHAWFAKQARAGAGSGSFTVSDALDEYLTGFRGKSTVDVKSRVEAIIRPALGRYELMDLTAKLIADWHSARATSPAKLRTGRRAAKHNTRLVDGSEAIRRRRSTANRDLTVLKAALNRAADHRDWLPVAAWTKVKPFQKVDMAKRRYLSDVEARQLVCAVEDEFRPMVKAGLLTGARYGELRHAVVKDYDRRSKTLWLAETKGSEPRPAYLDDEGVALFDEVTRDKDPGSLVFSRSDGRQWGCSHQIRRMADACVRAKLAKTTFHDLRRTYGARMALRGVPMAVIAEAMGHKDERITRKHYAHLSPSYVSETVRAAISGLGIVDFTPPPQEDASELNLGRLAGAAAGQE